MVRKEKGRLVYWLSFSEVDCILGQKWSAACQKWNALGIMGSRLALPEWLLVIEIGSRRGRRPSRGGPAFARSRDPRPGARGSHRPRRACRVAGRGPESRRPWKHGDIR